MEAWGGGLKRIFGVDGGAEGSLCVWKQSGCNTISACQQEHLADKKANKR